ncbi:MAG: hypothetical protein L0G25_05665 [Psychrobacter sp.]|nr:hypothetical protein [Psychrobacter sp.]
MTIIDQLDSLITPAILGDDSSVASISLLEQFYAILVSRLAVADVYNQLQRNQASIAMYNDNMLKQLWTEPNERELIISELAQTHHLDELETEHLITNAAHLGFGQLKDLANDQFLPAFLQSKQAAIRHYLPVWSSEIIANPITPLEQIGLLDNDKQLGRDEFLSFDQQENDEQVVAIVEETLIVDDISILNNTDIENAVAIPVITIDKDDGISNDSHDKAIPTSASIDSSPAYANSKNLPNTHANKSPNNWLIPILLVIIALAALALVWSLVIQPKFMQPAEPVIVEPVVIEDKAPIATVLKPAQLIIAVDNSGSLYTCTATIGDINLQNSLRQVLNTGFGEQANICQFIIEQGTATDLASISINSLPEILTLVRATPFARLELQDSSIRLEAPDSNLLQQLATNMRSLLPTTSVTTTDPTPLLNDANNPNNAYNEDDLNNPNGSFNNDTGFNTNNDPNSNYQPSDDDTNDRVVPAPSPNNDSFSNPNSINNPNNRNNAFSDRNQQSGPISESEVENLANTSIVAEPLRNARPVDRNITNNN